MCYFRWLRERSIQVKKRENVEQVEVSNLKRSSGVNDYVGGILSSVESMKHIGGLQKISGEVGVHQESDCPKVGNQVYNNTQTQGYIYRITLNSQTLSFSTRDVYKYRSRLRTGNLGRLGL